jgi:hypothetical protein
MKLTPIHVAIAAHVLLLARQKQFILRKYAWLVKKAHQKILF